MQTRRTALPFINLATLTALVAVFTLTASDAQAQSAQRWSLQGSLLYVGTYGEAYSGMQPGGGAEIQLRFTPGRLSIGIGAQSSTHEIDLEEYGKENATISGGFIEPRMVFDVGSDRFAPYGAARIAFLKQAATLFGVEASASGTQLNIGGGFLVRMTPRVNMDLGLTYGSINFQDFELSYQGETATVEGSSGSGQNLVIRVGIAVGLW